MYSQIGQVTSGQTSNPMLAASGKDTDSRDTGDTRKRETFQSVLSGTERSSDESRSHAREASAPEAETRPEDTPAGSETTDTADDDLAAMTRDAAEDNENGLPAFLSSDPDELIFKEKGADPSLTADEGIELGLGAAKSLETAAAVENTATPKTTPGSQQDNTVPAWFVTSRNTQTNQAGTQNAQQAGQISGAVQEAATPADNPSSLQGREKTPGVIADTAAQQIKPPALGLHKTDDASAKALAAAHRQAPGTVEEPNHVTERRATAEDAIPSFVTRRSSVNTANSSQPIVAALQAGPTPAAQEISKERTGIRWLSEVGFSSELAAQDLPATSRIQQTSLLQQPELPRHIAVQIAQAMRQGGAERPMELVLSPAELGRVRISMQAGDGTMTVHVMADRPETLDLMRRHIDLLAQEFHDIGFGMAEFAFGQNAPDGDAQTGSDQSMASGSTQDATGDAENAEDLAVPSSHTLHSDRVDIRL